MEPSGLLIFSVIKYAGYFFFFKIFNTKENYYNPFLAALIRLVAGLIIGFAILYYFNAGREEIISVYFTATLIGRIIIWYSLLRVLYKTDKWKKIILGCYRWCCIIIYFRYSSFNEFMVYFRWYMLILCYPVLTFDAFLFLS